MIIYSFILKTDVMRTVVSAMSDAQRNAQRHVIFCVETLQGHCARLRTLYEAVCKTLRQLEGLAQNNVPGAQDELERMLKLFEQECGYVERNPDPVAAGNSAAAGAPAGSAAGGAAEGSAGEPLSSTVDVKVFLCLNGCLDKNFTHSVSRAYANIMTIGGLLHDLKIKNAAWVYVKRNPNTKWDFSRRTFPPPSETMSMHCSKYLKYIPQQDNILDIIISFYPGHDQAAAGGDAAGSASAQSNGAAAAGGDARESDDDLYK